MSPWRLGQLNIEYRFRAAGLKSSCEFGEKLGNVVVECWHIQVPGSWQTTHFCSPNLQQSPAVALDQFAESSQIVVAPGRDGRLHGRILESDSSTAVAKGGSME